MNAFKNSMMAVAVVAASVVGFALEASKAQAACGVWTPTGTQVWCGNHTASLVQTATPQNVWVWIGNYDCTNGDTHMAHAEVFFSTGAGAFTPYFTASGWSGWTWGTNITWHRVWKTCFS